MDAADADALDALVGAAASVGLALAPDAVARLAQFVDLLRTWNERLPLTGERQPVVIVRKHVADSLALVPHLSVSGPFADIGSGAGFPGLVVACARPELETWLIESRRRAASFLAEAARGIGLRAVQVVHARAEQAASDPARRGGARVVVARALRPDVFLPLAAPLLAVDGTAIAMQTPRTADAAMAVAERHRFACVRRIDYRLPAGEPRCLLFFSRLC